MQTLLLSNALVRRGVDTHLVLHRAEGELLAELDPAVHIHNLGLEAHALIPLIAIKLDRALGTFDSGLVIVKLWASLLAVQLAVGHQRQLTYAICEDLDPLDHWRHIKLGTMKRRIITPIFRRSPLILANTERVADHMVESYSLTRRPAVLYGGVDVARIRNLADAGLPADLPQKHSRDGPLRIVTVASLRSRKGHPRILAALRQLQEPWEWHIVGDGPEKDHLKAQLSADIASRVHFHGATPNPYPYIARSHVLVHLPYSEAFGIVILEALALGVPVVSSPSVGPLEISEQIDPRRDHLIFVEPTDPATVAAAIQRLGSRSDRPVPDDIVGHYAITSTADAWLSLARSHLNRAPS
jgi:glycosyltransferase involved in cell wall biosynthesis